MLATSYACLEYVCTRVLRVNGSVQRMYKVRSENNNGQSKGV